MKTSSPKSTKVLKSDSARRRKPANDVRLVGYDAVLDEVAALLEHSRRSAARSVNAIMTATYWMIGRGIVRGEQSGKSRAGYGEALIKRLSVDLGRRFGRGFSQRNLEQMRRFYLCRPLPELERQMASVDISGGSAIAQTASAQSVESVLPDAIGQYFPLPWSDYVRLLSVDKPEARAFYEQEALRGGWSVRQLDRQIESQFYERVMLSKNKAAMLKKGSAAKPGDLVTPEEEIKDPYVLEFLDLKDEYSETELEEALIVQLETFLLELGGDFAFIGRQRRLRVGDQWYRIDLLFFHRRLRCLIVIDLKLGQLKPADAGQMHLYLNYAREHWTLPEENPPVGLIMCAQKNKSVAHYALEGLPNKVMAAQYRTTLPNETALAEELSRTHRKLEDRSRRE